MLYSAVNIILFDDLYAENLLPADDYRALHIKGVAPQGGRPLYGGRHQRSEREATLLSMTAEEIVFSFQANGDERADSIRSPCSSPEYAPSRCGASCVKR